MNGNGNGFSHLLVGLAREALTEKRRELERQDKIIHMNGTFSGPSRNAYLIGAQEERKKSQNLWLLVAGMVGFAAGCLYQDSRR